MEGLQQGGYEGELDLLSETRLAVVEVKGALDLWCLYHVWLVGTEGEGALDL